MIKALLVYAIGFGSPSVAVDITPFTDMAACERARSALIEAYSRPVENVFGVWIYHGLNPSDLKCVAVQ